MNATGPLLFALFIFFLGKKFYGTYLIRGVFGLDPEKEKRPLPSHVKNDGQDYVPTHRFILFGHHFSSIAGAAPIVGPAVAIIWGWVPAFLWVVLGVVFMGAAHDMGAMYLSTRYEGESVGKIAERILGPRSRNLFLTVIFFLVLMVIAVFILVISNLFIQFPGSVLPVNVQILLALTLGYLGHIRKVDLLIPSLVALAIMLVFVVLGNHYPLSLQPWLGAYELQGWIVILLGYCFIASALPVWVLLQPRDFINGHQLILGLASMVLGLLLTAPPIVAPAFNPHAESSGAPPLWPFLFMTIACGAISGFHGLVASGTTSKQVNKWSDIKPIGYGAMLLEGLLALLATMAVATGFKSETAWLSHYAHWNKANGLSAKISAFVQGASKFVSALGIPEEIAQTIIAVLIISFAATSLDTAARIQRYVIGEIGESWKMPKLKKPWVGSFFAVLTAGLLMALKSGGKGGLILWPLFGATNQMLATLTLLLITVYLAQKGRNYKPYLIPAVLVFFITFVGLATNTQNYFRQGDYFLALLGVTLIGVQWWMVVESFMAFFKGPTTEQKASPS